MISSNSTRILRDMSKQIYNITFPEKINTITVVGAGEMGGGIAEVAAKFGKNVNLVDLNESILDKARCRIQNELKASAKLQLKQYLDIQGESAPNSEEFLRNYVATAMEKINFSKDFSKAVKSTDIIIEAVPDEVKTKLDVLTSAEQMSPEPTLLATTSSTMSVNDLAGEIKRVQRFAALHFYRPPNLTNVLEVVRAKKTSDVTVRLIKGLGEDLRKTCVVCYDSPGYIINFLLVAVAGEAVRLLEAGVASKKDIDTALKMALGHKKGPFEIIDSLGVDKVKHLLEGWRQQKPWIELFQPINTINRMVEERALGIKTCEGFYKHKENENN